MPNARNVVAGKPLATGGVLMAPLGTAAPTGVDAPLDAGFTPAGYIGEDGLTETTDRSTEKVRAWGGDTVKVLQTDFAVTYTFTFLETLNEDVLAAVYGDENVDFSAATSTEGALHTVRVNGRTLPHRSFVFDMMDGDARIRIYVPDGQITEVGDVTYNDGEVVGYSVTVEAYRDSSIGDYGANAIKYLSDGRPAAA